MKDSSLAPLDASWRFVWETPLYSELVSGAGALFDRVVAAAIARGKPWSTSTDKPTAVHNAVQAMHGTHPAMHAILVGGTHMLLFTESAPWWDTKPWLIEQFYARVAPGRSDPLGGIEAYARDGNLRKIILGTSLSNDAAMGRLLARRGYQQSSTQFTKELPCASA